MKKSLLKDAFRQIYKFPGRFISIFTIVAIGAAFFAGIKTAAPNMKYTADQYYDDNHMMDIRMLSTMGFVEEDLEALRAVDGVEKVQPAYFLDVTSTIGSSELVFRIHSLPSNRDEDFINQPSLVEGRLPESKGECILEYNRSFDLDVKVGDTLKVSSGKKEGLEDKLSSDEFTVVGLAVSPYYLTFDKDASEIGSGKVNFFMMVVEEEFLYPVYLEMLVTVDGAKELSSYSKTYEKKVENVANKLENLGQERAEIRLASLKKEANEKLDEARQELAKEEGVYNEKIGEGEKELEEARDTLVDGEATLETERKNYEIRIKDANEEIRQGEIALSSAKNDYNQGLNSYNNAVAEYGDDLKELDKAASSLSNVQADAKVQRDSIAGQMTDGKTPEEIENLRQQYAMADELYNTASKGITTVTGLNSYAQSSMVSAESQLKSAKKQLNDAENQLSDAKSKLASETKAAEAQFASAESELKAGRAEYDTARATLLEKKEEGALAIEDGKEKIIRAENEIERLSEPRIYVLDRMKLYSYADYAQTADRMDAIASLFPLFFFGVSALVCLTTMTRMVDEQRTSIGIYKALGYGNSSIAFKYVNYAALASLLGGLLGSYVGIKVFPKIIFDSWSMMYTLPPMLETAQPTLMGLTVLAGVLVTTLTAYFVTRNSLKEVPATLMRPKAGISGKPIVLEKFTFLWKRLSFSQKVTMRNLFRYKKRFFMTVIGIAGCAALILAGFGLSNSISEVVTKQYQEIFTYNINMRYSPTANKSDKNQVTKQLEEDPVVSMFTEVSQMNATVKGDEDIAVTLISPINPEELETYIHLRHRVSGASVALPDDGVIINEKLAKELSVNVGDSISLDNGDGAVKKVQIGGITENYVFHYIYISPVYYTEIFRLPPSTNSLFIKLNESTKEKESALGTQLISKDQVSSVMYYSDAKEKFEDSVVSLNAIVYAIIISAALLAFVVLYNLTNINISERLREIATIKVLGFYNREVSAYVYRENILLTIIGSFFGLIVGIFLHRAIMSSIEQNGVMFGNFISGRSFTYAFFITLIFGILVNIFMYKKLVNIKMVESLKSVE